MENQTCEYFKTLRDFRQTVETRPQATMASGLRNQSKEAEADKWSGGYSWQGSLDAMRTGRPEVAERLKRDLARFKATCGAISQRETRLWYHGSRPSIPAAIADRPKAMRQTITRPAPSKTMEVVYDMAVNANVDSDTIERAGSAVLQLVYLLERSGVRVRLSVIPFASVKDNRCVMCAVCLKDYTQALDILKLSYPVTSTAFFRRQGFRWLETLPGIEGYWGGYGRQISDEQREQLLKKMHFVPAKTHVFTVHSVKNANFDAKKLAKEEGLL